MINIEWSDFGTGKNAYADSKKILINNLNHHFCVDYSFERKCFRVGMYNHEHHQMLLRYNFKNVEAAKDYAVLFINRFNRMLTEEV